MVQVKPSIHISLSCLIGWLYLEEHFGCQDILMLGRSPIKWSECLDMAIAVDWDTMPLIKQIPRKQHLCHGITEKILPRTVSHSQTKKRKEKYSNHKNE